MGIQSKAAIRGHPIHPMLVPFPFAFLYGAFAADLAFWGTADPFWARMAVWLTAAGFLTGVLAAIFGYRDFSGRPEIRRLGIAWLHAIGNASVLFLAFIGLVIRWLAPEAVVPWGLVTSAAIAGILAFTGWAGGEMSYRHAVGVVEHPAIPRVVERPDERERPRAA